jgi:hypothetical protein
MWLFLSGKKMASHLWGYFPQLAGHLILFSSISEEK